MKCLRHEKTNRRNSIRFALSIATIALVCAGVPATAHADVQYLAATQNPTLTSSFTLDFGVYGGPRSADITATQYTLAADPDAGMTYFLNYHQNVNPIELPGGISTGDITVTIQESTPGPYDPVTGVFSTHDMYLIYFTGDLSAYGMTSPVALPGSAGGTITYTTASTGTIGSSWAGQGELQNPMDPLNPIPFSYVCATNSVFSIPEPTALALFGFALVALTGRRS